MYHYQPSTALEELREEALLPNPVHIRDMIIRSRLSPEAALELNHKFQEYLNSFGETQALARGILEQLQSEPRKPRS
jgi:hypothetical protein